MGKLRRIIREALDASGGFAAAVRRADDQASVVVYSQDDLLTALAAEPDDMGEAFYKRAVIRGYIQIAKPDQIAKLDKSCNDAWEVHSVWGPGIGEMIYNLGFALSPTGLLMPDRLGVSPRAVARWEKEGGRRVMKPLDDFKHPPVNPERKNFHDRHHTDDPSDDCRMNKDGIDILNYSYEAQGGEKDMLNSMVTRHEETMTGVSSPEDVEDALFDSARRKFREAVK